MGFASKKGFSKFDKAEQRKEKARLVEIEKEKKEAQRKAKAKSKRDEKARKSVVIVQPKEKIEIKMKRNKSKEQKEIDDLVKQSKKQTRELESATKGLKLSLRQVDTIDKAKIAKVFKNALVEDKHKIKWMTINTKEERTAVNLALVIQNRNPKTQICQGNTILSGVAESESKAKDSIISISRTSVSGILIYQVEPKQIKIITVCTDGKKRGRGIFLMNMINLIMLKAHPTLDLVLDSVPSAIGFYERRGFVITGPKGNTTEMKLKR